MEKFSVMKTPLGKAIYVLFGLLFFGSFLRLLMNGLDLPGLLILVPGALFWVIAIFVACFRKD